MSITKKNLIFKIFLIGMSFVALNSKVIAEDSRAIRIAKQAISFQIVGNAKNKPHAMQWQFKASKDGRQLLSGNHYRLINIANGRGIMRQNRPHSRAANLGWLASNSKTYNVLIKRQKGNGQLRYGDVVALNLKPYGWLRYKRRGRAGGINLADDDHKPHYIWVVRGGNHGKKIYSGMPLALYNTKVKADMTYCPRTFGIDLGWFGKSKCNSWSARLSNTVWGVNGLFGKKRLGAVNRAKIKRYICETAIGTVADTTDVASLNLAKPVINKIEKEAVKRCVNL
ncbi:hypothetical protein [Leucothrix pacifica]|uniref:Uncharacterized protein n=1 Tax=Leucothrix pacifica TaxID=1247513 RepID=A0A317CFL7_9GAMM|nr:hypothetical protein [Leucothrix pacifica]PWQ95130.1 hypothetical protein DKW60_15520 [Leucothrix pacifica]